MKRTLYMMLMLVAMVAFVASVAGAGGMTHGKSVEKIKLSAIPATKATDSGEADFALSKDGETIHFVLRARDLENATMGHIHQVGPGGGPGAIIAWLYPTTGESPMVKEGKTTGVLSEGDVNASKLEGPMKGKTVKELYELIEHGKAGIAIHTKANPGGELWGVAKAERHMMKEPYEEKSGY